MEAAILNESLKGGEGSRGSAESAPLSLDGGQVGFEGLKKKEPAPPSCPAANTFWASRRKHQCGHKISGQRAVDSTDGRWTQILIKKQTGL